VTEGGTQIGKMASIVVMAWILSLLTTLALIYIAPSIFPPLKSASIGDGAIVTAKLADGTVTSAKIMDGTITATDLADGSILTVKIADGAVTTGKILDGTIAAADLAEGSVVTSKIADHAVTDTKLQAGAIPCASNHSYAYVSTRSIEWEDMPDMSVTITLARRSHLLILFSSEACLNAYGVRFEICAMVNSTIAVPETVVLTKESEDRWSSNSFIFHLSDVDAGTYTVRMLWRVGTWLVQGTVGRRTLNVIALPA